MEILAEIDVLIGQAIAGDWSLKVSMRTPKTMAKHTFAIKDVELP